MVVRRSVKEVSTRYSEAFAPMAAPGTATSTLKKARPRDRSDGMALHEAKNGPIREVHVHRAWAGAG